ncbi:ABC transporter substrate-binding protein [Sporichthya brevicatena]|uniref:ABC transporter substrate-binding protein n=2 Tax=Sporichthya brevicatena TaxID=171442 RepID=A0ABP3SEV1_9ACTN
MKRRTMAAGSALVLTSALLAGCGDDSDELTLNLYTAADGAEQYAAAAVDCTNAANGRYVIRHHMLPRQADDQRLQLARRIVGGDTALDIVGLDVTWTAEFAEAGWVEPLPDEVADRVRNGTLEGPLKTATWEDRLYAAPLNTNTQLLWYRKDLVPNGEPPDTWDELITIAEDLADQRRPSWIEVQANQYEGITVWFNTLLTSAGGKIVDDDGETVTLDQGDAARRALEIMARVGRAKGADPSLSQRDEGSARLAMESGRAVFQVNYPFVLPGIAENGGGAFLDDNGNPTNSDTGRRVQDEFAWAPFPGMEEGKPATVTIGGFNLAVPTTSKHPTEAFEAIECLRNRENQLRNAVEAGVPPTLAELYDDPAFQEEYPAWEAIKSSLENAGVRPASPAYQSISIVLSADLSPPSGIDPDSDVEKLTSRVRDAVNSEGLVP